MAQCEFAGKRMKEMHTVRQETGVYNRDTCDLWPGLQQENGDGKRKETVTVSQFQGLIL